MNWANQRMALKRHLLGQYDTSPDGAPGTGHISHMVAMYLLKICKGAAYGALQIFQWCIAQCQYDNIGTHQGRL